MIKEEKIKIRVSNNTVKFYNNKGYKCKPKDIIEISINDLPKQSTVKITAICDVCGFEKIVQYNRYINNFNNKNMYVCSSKCAQVKVKMTNLELYGNENFNNIKKRKETCKERYDNENFKNIEKRKKTNLEKYGVEQASKNEDVKEKRIKTVKEKYGKDHPMKNSSVVNKKIKSSYKDGVYNNNILKTLETTKLKSIENIKSFGVIPIDYINKTFFLNCDKGHIFESNYDLIYKRNLYNVEQCTICNPINIQNSGKELEFLSFIKEIYNGEIVENSRKIITPYELDIFLPEFNLAFEFNGLYWHNELNKSKTYHKDKYLLCKKNNIQLLHIWEDDWNFKQDIVKSMILNKLGKTINKIYARKTEVREISDNKIIRKFLNTNHIQGFVGSSIKIGLFYENELVSLMTFKKNKQSFELNRFCNKLNTNITGGASKLFTYFIKKYKYQKIISFSNNSYSDGSLYYKLGFEIDKNLDVDYSYIYNNKREHKFNFRKNKLKKYNLSGTEKSILFENKIYRIYDAGKIKFIYS